MIVVCFLVWMVPYAEENNTSDKATHQSFPLAAIFSETMITLFWAQQDSADAYNVYADYGTGSFLANPVPIESRTQFSFFWAPIHGEKRRVVKGNMIRLYVVAQRTKYNVDLPPSVQVVSLSDTVRTRYYDGFAKVETPQHCETIVGNAKQKSPRIKKMGDGISRKAFLREYPSLAHDILNVYRGTIDPRDEGACVPFATLVAKYFTARGIPCYRIQGIFISQFHNFNLVVIDDAEYILDFTADQFLPGSSPVLIPRDFCNIDSTGAPTNISQGRFTPMYLIDKVFSAEQVKFSDTPDARRYNQVLDSLLKNKEK